MATGDPVAAGSEQVTAPPAAPETPAGIQPPPEGSADPSRIALPPMAPAAATVPESHKAKVRFLDGVLVLLVLAFAFLCASFKAGNSDVFSHLAAGRLVAQGHLAGPDPFTFTASGAWINHSWLYDFLTYLIYSAGDWGGAALVVLKAIVVALTAALMLRAGSRPGQPLWIPAVCVLLAVLALSPRLLLQPHVVSFALLALTLVLLTRPAGSRARWFLPVVCLVWVNVDVWFFLGPLTILLYLAGEALQLALQRGDPAGARAAAPDLRRLGLVLAASLAACLVNPNHAYAFTVLPVGLLRTGTMETFRADLFRGYFLSPFEGLYLERTFGLSIAGLSYFVLLAVSLASFTATAVWNLEGLRYWRVLVWLALALLGGLNIRAVPFFAVAAGPIMSLNFLDLVVKMLGAEPLPERRWRRLAVAGRVLTAFAAAALVAASVPGWLQAQPHYRRQVGWGVEVDPGLRGAAEAVASWRERGLLPGGQHWFNTSPEVVSYFAWFCPGEKGFLDGRLELFGGAAGDFVAVRRSLGGDDRLRAGQGEPTPPAWRRVFADRDVSFLVFYSQELTNSWALTALQRLYANPDEFVPCYVGGSTAIFAWRAPQSARLGGEPARGKQAALDPRLEVDFNQLAFGKGAVTAPAEPPRPAGAGAWWQVALRNRGATPAETLTAVQHLKRFEGLSGRYQLDNERVYLAATAAQLVGVAPGVAGPLGELPMSRVCLAYNRELFPDGDRTFMGAYANDRLDRFLRLYDAGPAASLYLGLREARRGLAKEPDDILAQLYLAQLYNRLSFQTREYSATTFRVEGREVPVFPAVRFLRQAQMAAAGESVLKVNPRPDHARDAHMLLAFIFRDPQTPYFESHVKHFKEVVRLNKQLRPLAGVTREQYAEYLKGQEEEVKRLDRALKARRDQYEVDASRFRKEDVMQRANLAVGQGLAETALNLLIGADPKSLRDPNNPREAPGITLMIDLMLGLGRLDDVRVVLGEGPDADASADRRGFGTHPLGLPAYDWFQAQLGAATGDYEKADRALQSCLEAVRKSHLYTLMLARLEIAPAELVEKEGDARLFAGMLAGHVLLDAATEATRLPWHLVRSLPAKLYQARPPHMPKRDEDHPLQSGIRFLMDRLQAESDLWTLRAWLALEAGWIERAQEYSARALSQGDLGPDGQGQRYMVRFRSQPLAGLVQQLARNQLPRK